MEKEFTASHKTRLDVISRMVTLWKKHREWVWDSFLLFILFTVIFWIDKCLRPENKHLGDFFQIQNIFPILYFSPLGLVFPLLFGRKGSHIAACFYWFFLLFHGIEWFCWYKFDMNLDGNIVLILKITDANEVLTFWKDILHFNYLLIMIAWLIGGGLSYYLLFWKRFHWKPNKITLFFAIICLVIPVSFRSFRIMREPRKISNMFLCTHVIQDIMTKRTDWEEMATALAHPSLPEQLRVTTQLTSSKSPLGVLILGESATRNHWQSYGYARPTTPWIEARKEDIVLFRDVLTSASTTSVSLKYVLTQATLQNSKTIGCTVFDIYLAMNWDVKLFSAQTRWSNTSNRKQTLFFHSIQSPYYLKEHSKQYYDMDLLPVFREEIQKGSAIPTLYVFHLMGSHSDFKERYPVSFTRSWKTDQNNQEMSKTQNAQAIQQIDEYDNSIAYTDLVLGSIIDEVSKLDRPCFLFYLSDHGETPSAPSWRYMSDKDLWEIPAFLWLSPLYKEQYPEIARAAEAHKDVPLQNDRFFWGLVALGGITCKDFPEEENLFSMKYRLSKQRLIQNGQVVYSTDSSRTK